MSSSKKRTPSWHEALKLINRCPICSAAYDAKEAKVFAKNETARLVHLTCPTCRSFFVAMIVVLGQGLSSVGVVTDLSFEDVKRLHQTDPISTDEAIEGYQFIHQTQFSESLLLNRY